MNAEITLTGGRVTESVTRNSNTVLRTRSANAEFVHAVLQFLEARAIRTAPKFYGIDDKGRECLEYIPGLCPDNIGEFTDGQCTAAVNIVRELHDALSTFPGCTGERSTVCHYDLSPCNFIFRENVPCAVIDWDAARIGDRLDDIAYFAWMWLDIGSNEQSPERVFQRLRLILDTYGVTESARAGFVERILAQMRRVGASIFPTPEQTLATAHWASNCQAWLLSAAQTQCV